MHFVYTHIRQPAPGLVAKPVIAAFHVVRDQLAAPGQIRIDAEDARILLPMALYEGAVDPAAHGIALAAHLAVDEVYLETRAPVGPSGAHEPGAGRLQRTSVDDGADGKVCVVRVDQLSAHRPMLCRSPLRPERRSF